MKTGTTFLPVMFWMAGAMLAAAPAWGQTNASLTVGSTYTSTTFLDFEGKPQPGGLVAVSTTFHKPATSDFYGLSGKFTLPEGWTIDKNGTYDGDGVVASIKPAASGVTAAPEFDRDGVRFVYLGSFGNTPAKVHAARDFTIRCSVLVPRGCTGTKNVSVEWIYHWKPMRGPASVMGQPDPAVLLDKNPPTTTAGAPTTTNTTTRAATPPPTTTGRIPE